MATPSTSIYVCRVDFSNDYQHVVYFATVDEQVSYFRDKRVRTFTDYAHIRKNWTLKVQANIETAESWNYLYFVQNGKTYYYFITNVKYISDETVELSMEMDVMQTYMFAYVLKPCFVEREHASTDNAGDNTLDEGLELGAYTNHLKAKPEFMNNQLCLMMMTTQALDTYEYVTTHLVDNISTSLWIYLFDLNNSNDKLVLKQLLPHLDQDGKTDIIISMWMYPKELVEYGGLDEDFHQVGGANTGVDYSFPMRQTSFEGYTPKNKKLLTYPYMFIYATDNKGTSATYKYERFLDTAIKFNIQGSVFPDGGIKFTPKNYNGVGFNYDESITLTGLPTCPWVSDTYKLWLAQNQQQRTNMFMQGGITSLAGAGTLIAGVATANPMLMASGGAMAYGGITSIMGELAKQGDAELQPPQAHGSASSTLNAAMSLYVDFYARCITKERAQIIDDYFTMYGYKTLRVKVPNRNVRKKFTYTKTANCSIDGAICQEDIVKIQNIYNKGVTFWNKDAQIGNYGADNSIL